MTFAEALAMPPRDNAEGLVLRTDDGRMLKIKQSDYVALHRAISKLSARSIWEAMGEGATLDQIKFGMPEEFWDFIDMTYNELTEQQAMYIRAAHQTHTTVLAKLNHDYGEYGWSRKHYAALASQFSHRNLLFLLLDDRPLEGVVWKSLKPAHDGPFFKREEDVS